MTPSPFTVVVMAAQREGRIDPLAAEAGVSHKCLVPVAGRPMIAYVLDAILATPGVARIRISLEPSAIAMVEAALPSVAVALDWVAAADNIADSVHVAAEGIEGPLVVTTADNVLLTPSTLTAMAQAITNGADAAVGLTTRSAVLAAHPEGQRRFYRLRDDAYSNCNIYALAGGRALRAAETFRSGGQFVKEPRRMIAAFGLINVLLLRYRLVTLAAAMRRISQRLGVRIVAVTLADGSQAIDVDNPRSHRIATTLLEKRGAK